MPRPSAPALAVTTAVVIMLVVAAGRIAPFTTAQRDIVSSVPVPPELQAVSPVRIEPGRRACTDQVALDKRSGVAALRALPRSRDIPAASITMRAAGYRARGRLVAGTGAEAQILRASFRAPPGPRMATLCVRNDGRRTLAMVGTESVRTSTRSRTTIDGLDQPDLAITVYEAHRESLLGAAPRLLERAALYKAGFLRGWMLAPLALLVAIGVPLTMTCALWHALRAEGEPRWRDERPLP